MRLYISGIQAHMSLNEINLVTEKRRQRIKSYVRTEDKARCLVSGLLLRHFCGVTDEHQLTYGENGKPYLKDGSMYFNVSHSGDYVVLATADREIGVDIEMITPYPEAVAARCFTPAELEWMRSERTDEAFFRLWTAKESVMKATGLGFILPPETFCVLPMDSSAREIGGRAWLLNWHSFNGYMICAAIEGESHDNDMRGLLL